MPRAFAIARSRCVRSSATCSVSTACLSCRSAYASLLMTGIGGGGGGARRFDGNATGAAAGVVDMRAGNAISTLPRRLTWTRGWLVVGAAPSPADGAAGSTPSMPSSSSVGSVGGVIRPASLSNSPSASHSVSVDGAADAARGDSTPTCAPYITRFTLLSARRRDFVSTPRQSTVDSRQSSTVDTVDFDDLRRHVQNGLRTRAGSAGR